jgi:hypothetical protein
VNPTSVVKALLAERTTPEQATAVIDSLIARLPEPELAFLPQAMEQVYRQAHPKAEFKTSTMAQIEKRWHALRAERKNGNGKEKE